MKQPLVLILALLATQAICPPGQGQILETAGIYSKAGAVGAGLGAAVSASMKQVGGAFKPLTPEQRVQAEQTNKFLINTAQQEEKQGNHARAVEVYKKLGEWRLQVYGEKDKQAQTAFLKAGDIAMSQKVYRQAEDNYRHALTAAVKSYGPGTPELIPCLGKLVAATSAEGNYRDADSFASQIVALSEREYGANDARTQAARQQLLGVLQLQAEQLTRDNRTPELQNLQQRMATLQPPSAAGSLPAAESTGTAAAQAATALPSVPATTSGDKPAGNTSQ